LGGAGDGRRVDGIVGVEVAAAAGLAEVVHAEGQLGDTERRAEEREAVRVAVEDRHDRHTFFVRCD
jgi:hypothetical protein